VAGQREWGWVSQQLGIPNFPQDFPDCPAAADLAQLLAAEQVSPVLLLPLVMLLTLLFVFLAVFSAVESCHSFSLLCMSLITAGACLVSSRFHYLRFLCTNVVRQDCACAALNRHYYVFYILCVPMTFIDLWPILKQLRYLGLGDESQALAAIDSVGMCTTSSSQSKSIVCHYI